MTPHDSRDLEAQTGGLRKGPFRNDDNQKGLGLLDEERRRETADGDSSATYWKLYLSEAKISDQKLVETLTGDTNSVLILYSIFSSIIAGFITQASQALQPNNSQETVCLLSQLVSQGNTAQQSSPSCPGPYPGVPSEAAIRSNILLIVSFFLAVMSILACSLIQQWCRKFMKHAYPSAAPHKRGRVRTYLFQGLNRFHIRTFTYGIHALLHLSVFLFLCGVSDYLYVIYPRVGTISWYCVITSAVAYVALSIFPLIIGNCPYETALTPPLLLGSALILFFCRNAWRRFQRIIGTWSRREVPYLDRIRSLVEEANVRASHLDPYAMKWLFTVEGFIDTDMDKFLEALPGYIHSHFTITEELPGVLTAPYILQRIREHLLTCVTTTELSEQACIKRVSACVESLRVIFHLRTSVTVLKKSDEESLQSYSQSIVDGLNSLCEKPDEIRDLRAFCVRALAFQGILTRCLESTRAGSPNITFPSHFLPLYTFFSSLTDTLQDQEQQALAEVSDEDTKWRFLLYEGSFINLTLLARAILLHDDLDISPTSLSMCWKTLDILRSELRIARADISVSSLQLFNVIHTKTRRRVESEEPGFSVIPLLEILNAVDGGRRLSMVFQDHPKYRSKANLVFEKGHLRNPDLFHAFAKCLPDFVAKHPDKSEDFMEDLVLYDRLWTSLQVHLLNSLRPNCLIPAMIRVFDTCCTVIDTVFAALENSQKVDLRTPDFGSLAHYFEVFVTDCFQGMFVERAIGFRVGLIKARFCNAILAQFLDEFNRSGTVIFRSHWDVASLARVFYSLGVGNDVDVEFWKSYVDGGPIGPEFLAKAFTELETAKRDGPLLNFCRLGHLGMMAVPFEGSDLKEADFAKLLNLMQKMAEDSPLPLAHASTSVWEELRRLHDEVAEIYEKICYDDHQVVGDFERSYSEDIAHMGALLMKIKEVYRDRPSSTREPYPIDHVQARASGSSAVVPPNPPSRGIFGPSYAPTSTNVHDDRRNISADQGVDLRGITLSQSNNARGGFANLYRIPYPLLPSQIGRRGEITRPFSASFLPTLSPHLGSTDVASPGIPSDNLPLNHLRYNSEHRHSSVYFPPRYNPVIWASQLVTPLPHTEVFSSPLRSNPRLGSSNDGVLSVGGNVSSI